MVPRVNPAVIDSAQPPAVPRVIRIRVYMQCKENLETWQRRAAEEAGGTDGSAARRAKRGAAQGSWLDGAVAVG